MDLSMFAERIMSFFSAGFFKNKLNQHSGITIVLGKPNNDLIISQ